MVVHVTLSGGQSLTLLLNLVNVSLPHALHTIMPQGHIPCSGCPVQFCAAVFKYPVMRELEEFGCADTL